MSQINKTELTYDSDGYSIAANMYTPQGKPGEKFPALVLLHPFGAVKEQSMDLYAKAFAEKGFVTLAYDRRNMGKSSGKIRQYEDSRGGAVLDCKNAVTYLSTLDNVDSDKISVFGLCAGGGYAVASFCLDKRIKACATASAADLGDFIRSIPKEQLDQILVQAGENRNEIAKGGEPKYLPILPERKEDITKDTPELMSGGHDYYLTPRGRHPNQVNRCAIIAYDDMIGYDSYSHMEFKDERPLLLIAGENASTLKYSQQAYDKASEPKEIFVVENKGHFDFYDYQVDLAVDKATEFYKKHLKL